MTYSDTLLAALTKAAAINTAAAYNAVAGMTPELAANAVTAVRQSYVQGFRLVYLIAIAFGAAAIAAAASTVSTDRSKKNNARAVVMKNEIEHREAVDKGETKAVGPV